MPEAMYRPLRFTSRTQMVLVPVVVTDKSGRPVTGLSSDDFTLMESGKLQKIAGFEEVRTSGSKVRRALRRPGEFSNVLVGDQSPRHLTIIALDLLNTAFTDQARGRRELVRYLAQNVQEGQLTSLIVIDRKGIKVIHDFTTDPAVLIAALKKVNSQIPLVPGEGASASTSVGDQRVAITALGAENALALETDQIMAFLSALDESGSLFREAAAVASTMQAFEHIAQAYTGVPGRKSLIWVTGSFPFNIDPSTGLLGSGSPTALYQRTMQLLNNANIAVYPVDTRGLVYFGLPTAEVRSTQSNVFQPQLFSEAAGRAHAQTITTLEAFADMTGGRAFYNRNELSNSFREAGQDSSSYYMLSYYLDPKNTQPGWRKLSVKVRRDDARVRARSGFFATQALADPQSGRQMDIAVALQSPLDYTALPLTVRWLQAAGKGGKKKVGFEIELPANSATIDATDNNSMNLEFVAVARTPTGESAAQFSQTITPKLRPEGIEQVRSSGITYNNVLELAPGEYTVRFVVRDNISGRTGSVLAPLKVL